MTRALWFRLGWLQVVGVTTLCLWPLRELPGHDIPWSDKLYHGVAFGLLMWWFAVAQVRARWLRTGLLVCALGIAIEIAQGYVPFRAASVADALADGLGVLLGALAAHVTPCRLPAWRPRHNLPPEVSGPLDGSPATTTDASTRGQAPGGDSQA